MILDPLKEITGVTEIYTVKKASDFTVPNRENLLIFFTGMLFSTTFLTYNPAYALLFSNNLPPNSPEQCEFSTYTAYNTFA
jgi:hypothetical protein